MANKYIPTFLILIALFAFSLPSSVQATPYTGSLNASEGSLVVYGGWSNSTGGSKYLSWTVDYNNDNDFWTYDYTWHAANKDLSHIIIEVSKNLDFGDIILDWSADKGIEGGSPEGPKNMDLEKFNLTPPFNESIYGIKWDLHEDEDTKDFNLTVNSTRSPMWGDFFAKDGIGGYVNSTYAFNAGFGSDPKNSIDVGDGNLYEGDGTGWALVPNTHQTPVPEPSTMLLLGTGLVGVAWIGRRKLQTGEKTTLE